MNLRFNHPAARRRAQLAMTLTETMVSVAIGGVVLAAVASLSLYSARSLAAVNNYTQLDQQSRNALDQMSLRIRSASNLEAYTDTSLTFAYEGGTLEYIYSPELRQLYQVLNGSRRVLLEDCDNLKFTVFQRNVASNSFNQYLASGTNDAKSVMLNWMCRKSVLNLANTESIQSARIVIRNNP